jgi:hypothetical protein
MNLKNTLGTLLLASLLALPLAGCLVRGSGHAHFGGPVAVVEVQEAPPPPRYVTVAPRPGFIYIQGRWDRRGSRWVWRDGHYERQRAGYTWQQGRWERRGRGHVWVGGRWNAGGRARPAVRHDRRHRGPTVRDHRDRGRSRSRGPIVRDHR